MAVKCERMRPTVFVVPGRSLWGCAMHADQSCTCSLRPPSIGRVEAAAAASSLPNAIVGDSYIRGHPCKSM